MSGIKRDVKYFKHHRRRIRIYEFEFLRFWKNNFKLKVFCLKMYFSIPRIFL